MNDRIDPDPVVAAALASVDIPDHVPDFWADLDDRLAGHDDAVVLSLPTLPRPRRRFPTILLAAAAACAVAVGTVALLRDASPPETVQTQPTQPTEPAQPPATEGPGPPLTGTTLGVLTPAAGRRIGAPSPDQAVEQWIDALGSGRLDDAALLVGSRTEAYLAAAGADLAGVLSELQEGYGGWAGAEHSTTEIDLGPVDGIPSTVVVVSGFWRGEGEDGFRTDAIPVTQSGDLSTWLVEFSAFRPEGGRLELLEPEPGVTGLAAMTPDAAIRVSAFGEGTFWFSLDDGPPERVPGARVGGGVQARWDPPGAMPPQTHLLVVAYVDGETFTAFAGRFVVEG